MLLKRSAGAGPLPRGPNAPPRPAARLLALLLLALAVLLGVYVALALRSRWLPAGDAPVAVSLDRDFSGPAFEPEATVDDIRQFAQQTVDQLLEQYPRLVDAHYVQAHFWLMLDRSAESAAAWRDVLELDASDVNAYVSLATLLVQEEQYQEAVRLLRQAMACQEQDLRVPGLLADALFKQGEIEEATAILERQVRRRSASGAAVILLGQCYLQREDYERAATTLETAVASSPDSATAHYSLARAYQKLDEKELAGQHMARFQELQQAERTSRSQQMQGYNDVAAMREIACETLVDSGRIYLGQGDTQQAERTLLMASRLDELDQDCWELLVLLFETTAQPGKGLVACQKLCQINPGNAAYWLNVGLLHGRLMQREQALAAVSKALQLSPQDPECQRVYEILQRGQ